MRGRTLMRKTLLLLTTMTLALLLAAGVALAQDAPAQQTRTRFGPFEFMTVFPDPCNLGEEVTITGTATGFITEVVTPNGDYMYTLHLQQVGTGVGSEGSEYRYNFAATERFISEDPEGSSTVFTSAGGAVLNNLGSGPDQVATGVWHVTGLLEDPVVNFRLEDVKCRG
jgi:hypothetical protein